MRKVIYIAGPFTGEQRTENIQRAAQVGLRLNELGYACIVPHLSHYLDPEDTLGYEVWMEICLAKLAKCDAMIRIEGDSPGADREEEFADKCDIPIVHLWPDDFKKMATWTKEELEGDFRGKPMFVEKSVCLEAYSLVHGDRREAYDHPYDNHVRIAAFWNNILRNKLQPNEFVTPEDAVLCMIGVKLARLMYRYSRDSVTDICGYAECLDLITQRKAEMLEEGVICA